MNRPTLSQILAWIRQTIDTLGPTALPQIEAALAGLGLPAWALALIDAELNRLVGASASFRLVTPAAPPPDFTTLLGAVQADIAPVQQAQSAAAALPGLQTQLAADVAALTAALEPLLPAAPPA